MLGVKQKKLESEVMFELLAGLFMLEILKKSDS